METSVWLVYHFYCQNLPGLVVKSSVFANVLVKKMFKLYVNISVFFYENRSKDYGSWDKSSYIFFEERKAALTVHN